MTKTKEKEKEIKNKVNNTTNNIKITKNKNNTYIYYDTKEKEINPKFNNL